MLISQRPARKIPCKPHNSRISIGSRKLAGSAASLLCQSRGKLADREKTVVLRRRGRIPGRYKIPGPLWRLLGQILSAPTDLDSEALPVARSRARSFLVNHVRRRVFASQCVEEVNNASSSSSLARSTILSPHIPVYGHLLLFRTQFRRGFSFLHGRGDFSIPLVYRYLSTF